MTSPEERVETAINERREGVNAAIPEELPLETPEELYEASRYLIDAGGKRLRPAILLLVAESLTGVTPGSVEYRSFPDLNGHSIDIMKAAVSIEIIHLFTLIHDDIMDNDELRRGVPTVHQSYGDDIAILAGDTLYSKAFEIILNTGAPPDRAVTALDRLATTCTQICEGQALDIDFESRDDVGIDDYRSMIELKTAVLYGAAASVPALLLGASATTSSALYRYGLAIGRAFQIQDDVLDLTASSEVLGKQRGSDLIAGKQTLITVHAREQGIDPTSLIESEEPDEHDIDTAVERLESVGSIEYARSTAREYVSEGQSELEDALPENEARDILHQIANYLLERSY